MKIWMELAKIAVWSIPALIIVLIFFKMFRTAKTPEIQNLILVLAFGTILAFGATRIDKWLDKNAEKERAMMWLNIELRASKESIGKVIEMQSMRGEGSPLIPSQDILELDKATQFPLSMSYEGELAEKVSDLSTCLRFANNYREVAWQSTDPISQLSSSKFLEKLEQAQKILKEINKITHFEENSPKS